MSLVQALIEQLVVKIFYLIFIILKEKPIWKEKKFKSSKFGEEAKVFEK